MYFLVMFYFSITYLSVDSKITTHDFLETQKVPIPGNDPWVKDPCEC